MVAPKKTSMIENGGVPTVENVVGDSVIFSSRKLGWVGLEVMQAHFDFNEMIVPALASHTIVINMGKSFELEGCLDGHQQFNRWDQTNLTIVSSGIPSEWIWAKGVSLDMLHLSLNSIFFADVVKGIDLDPTPLEIINEIGIEDHQIQQIGLALVSELQTIRLADQLYAESLANILSIHLLRNHSSISRQHQQRLTSPNGGLSPKVLKRVTDYINDNIAGELRLVELASLSQLSSFHFARLFKQTTGLSPHQYVLKCRLERARWLLQTTNLPVQLIAYQVGFGDQSHFNRQFRLLFGCTPGAIRK